MIKEKWDMLKRFIFYVCCLVVAINFGSCGILNHYSAKVLEESVSHGPFDVVIVPGLPYDSANMSPLFKGRMLWAKELYEKGIAHHIIFSGSAVHSPYIEGVIMKMMADSMGIPTRHTFIEDRALHTHENITYGIKLAHNMGFKKIAIATDPIQALLVKKHTRDNGAQVHILPFSMKSMSAYYKTTMPQIAAGDAFVQNFIPLKDRPAELLPVLD